MLRTCCGNVDVAGKHPAFFAVVVLVAGFTLVSFGLGQESKTEESLLALVLGKQVNEARTKAGLSPAVTLELGIRKDKIDSIVLFPQTAPKTLLQVSHYDRLLSFLPDTGGLVLWKCSKLRANGFPTYVLAVFSSKDERSSLIDLLLIQDGQVYPIRNGLYAKALKRIKKGMSVREMYSLIGVKRPNRYHSDRRGKWFVSYEVTGLNGEVYAVSVDAATGRITDVRVSNM